MLLPAHRALIRDLLWDFGDLSASHWHSPSTHRQ
jgi:hypothetical protein